jgi:leader peptidase (prepilin peptidase) / N-methyltransferase
MSGVLVGCCALLGAAAGAVTPRVAYRLSVHRAAAPRHGCVRCGTPFGTGPAGWVRAGAVCPGCPADPPPWLTTAAGAAVLGALGWVLGATPLLLAYLAAAILGVLLAFVDVACLRLPDPLVGALAVVGAAPLAVLAVVAGEPHRLGRAALAAAACFAAYLSLAIVARGRLGLGDVKLAGVLGFLLGWLGWPAVLLGLALPHLLNGPVVLALLATGRVRRRSELPFGPALLLGALLAVLLAVLSEQA